MPAPKRRLSHEQTVFVYVLLSGLLPVLACLYYAWIADETATPKGQWTPTIFVLGLWFGFALAAKNHVVRPLHTMANLLSALREGDFAIRAGYVAEVKEGRHFND